MLLLDVFAAAADGQLPTPDGFSADMDGR